MKIVDFHTHIFPPEIIENREDYLKKDALFSQLYSNPKALLSTAEELISSMDDAGIATSVALNINWLSHDLCVKTNDYILDAVFRYPKRLVGFAMVNLNSGDAALQELNRCVQGGIKGIGEVRPSPDMFEGAKGAILDSLAQMVREHNLIVATHSSEPVGHRYAGKGKVNPGLLYRLISKYPDLKIVCAHWGGGLPFYELMPEVSQSLKNTFYDTAASSLLYKMEIFKYVTGLVGAEKVLFGSDFPLISPKKFIQKIKESGLTLEVQEDIFSHNAEKLLI